MLKTYLQTLFKLTHKQAHPDFSKKFQASLPSVPSPMKFLIGGATPLVLSKAKNLIEPYVPTLKALEVIDGDNNLDIDKANVFINNGFNTSGKFEYMGFIFSKDDGTAFVALLNKYKDMS